MSGPLDERQALASIVLWASDHFDTRDIADVFDVKEDKFCRTLLAARSLKGRRT